LTILKAIFIAFIPTQLPIGLLEGFAAAGFFTFVLKRRPDILANLGLLPAGYVRSGGGAGEGALNEDAGR
jgi:cobalt/nickel transport system permease protein